MYQTHHIPVTRTARFVSLGDRNANIKEVWFVLHGYGQLAEDFIKDFEALQDPERFIVAPEGLSRFYMQRGKKVGACWMTRECRENEISDYLAYLNQVALFVYDMLGRRVPTTVLGFSQGATTASRWVTLGRLPASRLILWAGDIARDLDVSSFRMSLNRLNPLFVVGSKDEFITPERLQEEQAWMDEHKIEYELITFDGGHVIDSNVLRTIC